MQFHAQPLSLDKFGDSLHTFPAITISVCNLRPTSRGSVHAEQQPLAQYQPEEFRPGAEAQSDEALVAAARAIGSMIFHPVGTTKMGPASDANAVVDHRLRVLGIDRLRIADASVMPNITSGNTNTPTMMIAGKAAAMIAEDWK